MSSTDRGGIEKDLGDVLDDRHPHDCATLYVDSPEGSFSMQLATGAKHDGPVWNIADSPPGVVPEEYPPIDVGSNYFVVESDAETATEAIVESRELASHLGGTPNIVTSCESFVMFKGLWPAARRVQDALGRWKQAVQQALGRGSR